MKKINKITDTIMDSIADALSSKLCFLIFLIWALLPAIFSPPETFLQWNSYISQTVIQLVALSILGYNSKKEGKTQRQTIDETHSLAMNEIELMKLDTQYDKEAKEELISIIHELHEHVFNIKEGENK